MTRPLRMAEIEAAGGHLRTRRSGALATTVATVAAAAWLKSRRVNLVLVIGAPPGYTLEIFALRQNNFVEFFII